MASYDLSTEKGREQCRKDRQAELDAIHENLWPRNHDDMCRWDPMNRHPTPEAKKAWAKKMCVAELAALKKMKPVR